MREALKFSFGTTAKEQVAKRIQAHVQENFHSGAEAAESLAISRQRLFSYTSGKALPRAPVIDLILERWGLDLLGDKPRRRSAKLKQGRTDESRPAQRSLFDSPIRLESNVLTVVIRRNGPRLVASIEISADVKIA